MKAFILLTLITFSHIILANPEHDFLKFTHPMELNQISDFISKTNPSLNKKIKQRIALSILKTSLDKKLPYVLLLSIVAVESSFKPNAKSHTGDYSIVQINYEIWSKEFQRLKKDAICLNKLKNNIHYSIDLMGEILVLLRDKYEDQDPIWFARYHSKTPSLKQVYFKRLISKNILGGQFTLASN